MAAMDDSLIRDQLSLWDKLNRLYGDGRPEEQDKKSAEEQPGSGEPNPEAPPAGKVQTEVGPGPAEPVNQACLDCEYDCRQPADDFVISRCKIAQKRQLPGVKTRVGPAVRSSMGLEKINETCRQCRKSCKQTTKKLNHMLCLGFGPIAE
jgi:hypothetical protein